MTGGRVWSTHKWGFAALSAMVILALSGCGVLVEAVRDAARGALSGAVPGLNAYRAEEKVGQIFSAGAAPEVVVETFNGAIDVVAGAGDQVAVEVTKRASGPSDSNARDALSTIEVTLTQDGNTVRVTARRTPGMPRGNAAADVKVTLPAGASLQLNTGNGSLTARGVTGRAAMRTGNGDITVRDGQGSLRADTGNGSIHLQATDASVWAKSGNGSIRFDGSLSEGDQTFDAGNGSIVIVLPADASFRVDATTGNGRATSDFPVQGQTSSRSVRGAVGANPVASIQASTGNGSISLQAR